MIKIPVALFGTGAAALEFIECLDNHPDFELVEIYGNTSAGKLVGEVLQETETLKNNGIRNLVIRALPSSRAELLTKSETKVFCSALSDESGAKEKVRSLEGICASIHPTFSTTSVWRYDQDSFILIPEVNFRKVERIMIQAKNRGWQGFIAPGPNCTTVGPAISLRSLFSHDSLREVVSVYFDSKQAVSGAGRAAYQDLLNQRMQLKSGKLESLPKPGSVWYEGNVRCKIEGEETKVKNELRRICGANHIAINGMTHRVATEYGHIVSMYVETKKPIPERVPLDGNVAISDDFFRRTFGHLHSSPEVFVRVSRDEFGPQPLFEAELYGGMCTHIGQISRLDGRPGIKYDVLSHNLKKGAAKGSIQVMEYLHERGYF